MQLRDIYTLFSLFFISINLYSQLDNNKLIVTGNFNYQPDNDEQLNFTSSNTIEQKGELITRFGTLEDISDYFPKYSVNKKGNKKSMSNHNQRDKDILVKKYWNGKDVSVVKLKTKLELGKIETNTQRIRIECRDHSYVDGDRVRLYVNEKVVRSNIVLQGGYYTIDINLNDGFNRIDIEALNQGLSGPNTAEFNVYDENGKMLASKEWNILTGYIATLIVLKN